ncbi:hypothetical protein PG994_004456 [Apiospora phragmitis]|uniref:Uncharacterized protein n=1 Tax=Apiospora phragmitis TaxID=2905665 RepID=A0ABR1VQW3_9PEZI
MEGPREKPVGAGGHHHDGGGRKDDIAKLSMSNDLGIDRLEEQAQDDDWFTSADTLLPAAPVRSIAENGWQNAVQSDVFVDDDSRGMKGLDPIANGRLHADRRSVASGAANGPRGLSLVRAAQSNGHGARANFGNAPSGPSYDPMHPQKRGHSTPLRLPPHQGHSTPPSSPPHRGPSKQSRSSHHQGPAYGSDQVSKLGIVMSPGANLFTFKNSKSASSIPQRAPPPSEPIQLQPRGPTMFDAPRVTSTLNNNQKRSASHQEGSNPLSIQRQPLTIFSAASVVGVVPRLSSSSSQANGNTNAPSNKRIKATPPHLRPASGHSGVTPSGSASRADVTLPSQRGLTQSHPSVTSQLDGPTTQPQQSFHIIFECEVNISRALPNTDGTIPTSGKVFLYTHPTNGGWIIWELQRNNGFVTRDDVRAFINTFSAGSNVILRRRTDATQPLTINNLLFPSMIAADELKNAINLSQERMNSVNAPQFEERTFEAPKTGVVDLHTLLELHQTPESGQTVDQPLAEGNNNHTGFEVVQKATNGAQHHNHGEDQRDNRVPPHKRSVKRAPAVQASETIEGNTLLASQSTQKVSSGAQHQENPTSSLIDMKSPMKGNSSARGVQASPMPTKLIKIEAEDKGKRPESEYLRGLTYEVPSSSAIAGLATKPPSSDAIRDASQQISRSNLDVAGQVISTDAKTYKYDALEQQPMSHSGSASDIKNLNTARGGEDDMNQDADDHSGDQEPMAESTELGNEPEQSTELVLAPVLKTIQLHDVERKLPVRNLSSASEGLIMGMTSGKWHGLIESVEGLNTLLATWQTLYQNPAFRCFNDDDKLNTVAVVYDKVCRDFTNGRIRYSIHHLMDLRVLDDPDTAVPNLKAIPEVNKSRGTIATPPAASETSTLGQIADKTEKAIKQKDQKPVTKIEPQPEASSSASQVPTYGANQTSQMPAKKEETILVARPQTPSPLTPTQNSQVPGDRTGSQGLRSALSHMRGIRQNLGSAGLGGSRWA